VSDAREYGTAMANGRPRGQLLLLAHYQGVCETTRTDGQHKAAGRETVIAVIFHCRNIATFTCAKEVMFSSASICLLVSRIAQNCWIDFHRI